MTVTIDVPPEEQVPPLGSAWVRTQCRRLLLHHQGTPAQHN